jgi:catalase
MADLYEEIVDAMNELSGVHPGYRAAHAKGILCTGEFTATPEASGLSRAPHLAGDSVNALVRFSNGGGDPHVADTERRDGRGMATSFELPDGSATDIVAITLPVFFVRTAHDFLDFVRARKPDPDTGELDMEKVGAFLGQHPETQAALELILPTFVPPASYAQAAYNSLHAFGLVSADGEKRFVRYRWEPEAGEVSLTDEEIESRSPDYLQDELRERLDREPIVFTLTAKLAEEGDPLEDPTVPWPDDREALPLGQLEVSELAPPQKDEEELLVFDPTKVCDGIECSDDEILATRSKAYSVSAERRAAARKPA